MSKILFSPLGLTDPISNFKDGAMLHICRYCDIDIVYMYLSEEIYEYHKHDNRYVYCLEQLGKSLNKKIEYRLIIRNDLKSVHLFDYFIDEFRIILNDIHNNNPDDEIYVNVSSGTPGMKSALQILSAFREFEMIPVQVSTPKKRSNPHIEDKLNYHPEEMWKCNEDNNNVESRCEISQNINFLLQMKKQMLSELINKYDYSGAIALALTMKNSLSNVFLELLDGALKRYSLDFESTYKIFQKYGCKILQFDQYDKVVTVEYILSLDVKIRKGELGDFVRGITPLIVDLFERILAKQFNFILDDFVKINTKGIRKWDISKLNTIPRIKKALDLKYGKFKGKDISSDHLVEIIAELSDNKDLTKLCNELRSVEIKIRNSAAHTMISITDDILQKRIGYNAKTLLNKLFLALQYGDIDVKSDLFDSYDKMNKILLVNLYK